jgi:hypothetical protein
MFDDIIAVFSLFNHEKLGCISTMAMEYGIEEIGSLVRQYQGLGIIASTEECIDEWKSYRHRQFMQENCGKMKFSKVIQELCTNSTTISTFPNMSTLETCVHIIAT